jgi:hypothetical protein
MVAGLFAKMQKRMVVTSKKNRSADQQAAIDSLYTRHHSFDETLKVHRLENQYRELKQKLPTTMVMKELPEPRQTYVLNRGLYDQPDKQQPVSAAVPELFQSDVRPANRLELAKWLVDGNNPLTARVAVNQFWARYFGIGLLDTPENFGVQSPPPSHPLLLDWLATEFVRTEWDVKAMQKLIVMSSTYRQQSAASPEAFASDPDNRRLARGPRFRLPAESIRDNALAISGLLTKKMGGPSVMPYQPEGLWAELAGGAKEPPYQQATNEDLYRRSLYIYRKRTVPHPTMTTFDGVGRDICAVDRDRTNTPLQALALLNDTTYVEAAIHLAVRAIDQETEDLKRIQYAFRCATGRRPNDDETALLRSAFERYLRHFENNTDSAQQLIRTGQKTPGEQHDSAMLAAYATVCSVILNLDEVITKE